MRRPEVFADVADLVGPVVRHERVGEAWSTPSALAGMSVGALATHLAGQVVMVHAALLDSGASPKERPISLQGHYSRAAWVGSGPDHESNVSIRENAEKSAVEGQQAVVARFDRALAALRRWPHEAPTKVRMPWWDWSLSMDDFLLTRMMELMVHCDDLAVSVGLQTPHFPRAAAKPVLTMLTTLAEQRYGQPAVLRALTRSERAPEQLSVF